MCFECGEEWCPIDCPRVQRLKGYGLITPEQGMKASPKSPDLERFLEEIMGRTTAIKEQRCCACNARVPLTALESIQHIEERAKDQASSFRDSLSEKEYTISGLCQDCQDKVFGREK